MVNLTEAQAELFGVFANATRIKILYVMAEGALSVGRIAEQAGISMQTASHHLRYMRGKGILKSRRVGQSIRYRIAYPDLVFRILSMVSNGLPTSFVEAKES